MNPHDGWSITGGYDEEFPGLSQIRVSQDRCGHIALAVMGMVLGDFARKRGADSASSRYALADCGKMATKSWSPRATALSALSFGNELMTTAQLASPLKCSIRVRADSAQQLALFFGKVEYGDAVAIREEILGEEGRPYSAEPDDTDLRLPQDPV